MQCLVSSLHKSIWLKILNIKYKKRLKNVEKYVDVLIGKFFQQDIKMDRFHNINVKIILHDPKYFAPYRNKKSSQAMINWKKIIINMYGKWDNFLTIQLNHENQYQTIPVVK